MPGKRLLREYITIELWHFHLKMYITFRIAIQKMFFGRASGFAAKPRGVAALCVAKRSAARRLPPRGAAASSAVSFAAAAARSASARC